MSKTIGYTFCPLETRFEIIRHEESNFANFFADLVRYDLNADIAIINSGTIRYLILFKT